MKPKNSVQQMEPYFAPTSGRKGFLRLDFNENTVGVQKSLGKFLSELDLEQLSAYPEYGELEKAIAEYAGVKLNEVLACNGSDEAIRIAFDCFLEKGKKVILPWPSFAMFEQYAKISCAQIEKVLFEKNLGFPAEKVLEKIDSGTGAVVLCNPNNPTGTIIKRCDIERILEKAKQNNALVLVDEAYFEFSGQTAVPLLERFNNLVVTRTFSKAFGLAGLRLGYLVSCVENVREMQKVVSPYAVNAVAALAGVKALQEKRGMEAFVQEVLEAKKLTEKGLKKLSVEFFPSAANFLLARFGNNCSRVIKELKEAGILIRDRSSMELLGGCARITIGTIKQMKWFLQRLENILKRKNLVFDLDGVLVDVSKSYRIAIKKTAEFFLQQEVSLQEIQEMKNKTGLNNDWELTEAIIKEMGGSAPLKKIIEKFQAAYLGENYNGLILRERFLLDKRLLKLLSRQNTLCIFTGRPREEALFALRKSGTIKFFKKIVSMDDLPEDRQKPDPFGLLLLKKEFCNGKNYYFGDTVGDMVCAKRAGFIGIGVLPPQDKSIALAGRMLQNGACTVVKSVNEIARVLE